MIGSKFFFDSAPLIYLVEFNETYYDKISLFVAEAVEQELQLLTSVISIAEFGVKPKKLGNRSIIRHFEKTITRLFDIHNIDAEVADISSSLQAKYPTLRGMDAMQLACSIKTKADFFITNDKRLRSIKEIEVLLMKDL